MTELNAITKSKRKFTMKDKIWKFRFLYLMLVPGLIWLVCFHLLPLWGIQIAFYDFKIGKGLSGSKFVGLDNFKLLLAVPDFLRIFRNTVCVAGLKLLFGFPAQILLALSINTIANKMFKKVFQTISYLPFFISWVILYGIATTLFSDFNGVFANIFAELGWEYTNFTTNPKTFYLWLVLSSMWKGLGMGSIIYLAALAGVDVQLYEAAKIDGASRTKQLLFITLPCIMPTIAIVFILNSGSIMSGDLEQHFLYLNGDADLFNIGDIFDTWVYANGIKGGKYSLATALEIFRSIVAGCLVLLTNWIAKKLGNEGIW